MIATMSVGDVTGLYRPSACERRPYMKATGAPAAEAGPLDLLLRKLGIEHEARHLSTIPGCVDLSAGTIEERARATLGLLAGSAPLYQPVLAARVSLGVGEVEVVGIPDFLLPTPAGWVIRDCKMARRINDKDHPEILRQLQGYAYLLAAVTGRRPAGLEVFTNEGTVVPVDPDDGAFLRDLGRAARSESLQSPPWEAVGWTKCQSCAYEEHCWPPEVARRAVATLPSCSVNAAGEIRRLGAETAAELLARLDAERIAGVNVGGRRLGLKTAAKIFTEAEVAVSGAYRRLAPLAVPARDEWVMLDLEGLLPNIAEEVGYGDIFLWGLKEFGAGGSRLHSLVAGPGIAGDGDAWRAFLAAAGGILRRDPTTPFVHWHHYEKTWIKEYRARHGDPDGVADRLLGGNLLDLLPVAKAAFVLPLPSMSLKVVEKAAGYARRGAGLSGDWAVARFVEAAMNGDPSAAAAMVDEIVAYNEDDLDATWAVLRWLRRL